MFDMKCDDCGRSCGQHAFVMTTEVISNPCPMHLRDTGRTKLTDDTSSIKYILCQKCYRKRGLPNVYASLNEGTLTFDDVERKEPYKDENEG